VTRFQLTAGQLDVLWHHLGLGRLPYPLDVPSVGATMADRERLRDEVLARLADPRLGELLRLLAGHEVAVDAIAHVGRPVRALATSDRRRAVLAVLDGGVVGLTEIRPTALAKSVVDLLPDNVSGPGAPRTLRVETLHRAVAMYEDRADHGADPWGNDELDERGALVKAGLPSAEAKAVVELAAGRVAGGQFGLSWSSGGFAGTRAPILITWFDTHQGRYLMVRDGHWLSIASTDRERITARIAAVLSTVVPEHHHIASIR